MRKPTVTLSLETAQRLVQALDGARENLRSSAIDSREKASACVDQALLDFTAFIQEAAGKRP